MEKLYSVKDIAKLIKLCKTNNVSSLKLEGFELSIGETENPQMTPLPPARGSAKKAQKIAELSEEQLKFDEAQDLAATLQLENPALYEAMLAANELEEKDH